MRDTEENFISKGKNVVSKMKLEVSYQPTHSLKLPNELSSSWLNPGTVVVVVSASLNILALYVSIVR
jgi:hypothetical protein